MQEMMKWNDRMDRLEAALGYAFHDRELIKTALTHSSYVKGAGVNAAYNERIEFLGDAVLELTVSERLYLDHPELPEGSMTRVRARLVCEDALFHAAAPLDIADCLRLGYGEEHCGGRENPSIIADAMEAVLGAIYLDGGLDAARAFVSKFILPALDDVYLAEGKDYKTRLQEFVQNGHLGSIVYETTGSTGPEHDKRFHVSVSVDGAVKGSGSGRTIKAAGQEAAAEALRAFSEDHIKKDDGEKTPGDRNE